MSRGREGGREEGGREGGGREGGREEGGSYEKLHCTVHNTVYTHVHVSLFLSLPPPLGSLSWCGDILCSGSRDNMILQWDPRLPAFPTRRLLGHAQEVCGLQWSPNRQHLASGGNDNKISTDLKSLILITVSLILIFVSLILIFM